MKNRSEIKGYKNIIQSTPSNELKLQKARFELVVTELEKEDTLTVAELSLIENYQLKIMLIEIELEIGKLSGVEPYALDFAWDQAILKTVLEKAKRKTLYIEAKAECQDCGHKFEIDNLYDECPVCKSYMKELISGRELRVKSLTVI